MTCGEKTTKFANSVDVSQRNAVQTRLHGNVLVFATDDAAFLCS